MDLNGALNNTGTLVVESEGDVTMWSHAASTPHQVAQEEADPSSNMTLGLIQSTFRLHQMTVKADGKVKHTTLKSKIQMY